MAQLTITYTINAANVSEYNLLVSVLNALGLTPAQVPGMTRQDSTAQRRVTMTFPVQTFTPEMPVVG